MDLRGMDKRREKRNDRKPGREGGGGKGE